MVITDWVLKQLLEEELDGTAHHNTAYRTGHTWSINAHTTRITTCDWKLRRTRDTTCRCHILFTWLEFRVLHDQLHRMTERHTYRCWVHEWMTIYVHTGLCNIRVTNKTRHWKWVQIPTWSFRRKSRFPRYLGKIRERLFWLKGNKWSTALRNWRVWVLLRRSRRRSNHGRTWILWVQGTRA